jgi:hypothetical protein
MKTILAISLMIISISTFGKSSSKTYGCSILSGGFGKSYGVVLKCTNPNGQTVAIKFGSNKQGSTFKGVGLSAAYQVGIATLNFDGTPDQQTGRFNCEAWNSGFVAGISYVKCSGNERHNQNTSLKFRGYGFALFVQGLKNEFGGGTVDTKVTFQTLPY